MIARGAAWPPPSSDAVFFGDSITSGTGASDAAHRWANLVAASKGWTNWVNAGVTSTVLQNTTQTTVSVSGAACELNGRDTFASRVVAYVPKYVLFLYGLNDIRLNDAAFSSANFQTDLGEIIDRLVLFGVSASRIVIGSPPYIPTASYSLYSPYNGGSTVKHAAYVTACSAVANAKSTAYIDVYQWMVNNGGDSLIGGDGLHPNDAGHAAIANAFLNVL